MPNDAEPTVEFRLTVPLSLHTLVQEIARQERRTTHNQYIKLIENWLWMARRFPDKLWESENHI